MKKSAILMCMVMAMTLCSCTQQSGEKSSMNVDNSTSAASQDESSTAAADGNIFTDPIVADIPTYDIYVDMPSNYRPREEGTTEVFIVTKDEEYVTLTYEDEFTGTTPEEANDTCFYLMEGNMSSYEGGIEEISIEKSENIVINEIEMYKFEGKIGYGKNYSENEKYDGYAYGYAFIMDGVACQICGSIIGKDQDGSKNEELKEMIDYIATTVRTEE